MLALQYQFAMIVRFYLHLPLLSVRDPGTHSMNKNYKLVFNRSLGAMQVAPETASRSLGGQVLKPLAAAVMLALLGSVQHAHALPGSCVLSGSGPWSTACAGNAGSPGGPGFAAIATSGGPGGDAATGSGFDLDSAQNFTGGNGGAGGNNTVAGNGGTGGAGLRADTFQLINRGTIRGGDGGPEVTVLKAATEVTVVRVYRVMDLL